jgi:hypothetical protein
VRTRAFDVALELSHLLIVMKAATWNHDLPCGALCARTAIGCEQQPMFVVVSTE